VREPGIVKPGELGRPGLLAAHDAGTVVTGIARAEQFQAARLAAARRGAGPRRR
jgi:hypothetical protein